MELEFTINFTLRAVEGWAADHGFSSANWKSEVLADLLYDGKLKVREGHDPRNPSNRVWHCMGRRCSITCVADNLKNYALFCIGLVAGPDVNGHTLTGTEFDVPGPWSVDTYGRRASPPISVEQHIRKCAELHRAPSPSDSPFAVLSKRYPVGDRGSAAPLAADGPSTKVQKATVRRRVGEDEPSVPAAAAPIGAAPTSHAPQNVPPPVRPAATAASAPMTDLSIH
jgi:hypothetical protein